MVIHRSVVRTLLVAAGLLFTLVAAPECSWPCSQETL